MDRPLLSVVIPVHNEEGNLPELVRRLTATAEAASGEVAVEFVFVDDGSTDESFAVLEKMADDDPRIVVVQLTRNWGSHAALKAGLHAASGDCYAAISADLQDPPEMLPEFYRAYRKGFEVVWGVRAFRKDPFFKTLWAKCFYALFRRLALANLPVGGVDTFLISRNVRDQLLACKEQNNLPYYLILWMGYSYAVVPYERTARRAGVSKWTFRRRLKSAVDAITAFSDVPLRLLTVGGSLLSLCGLAWGSMQLWNGQADAILGPLICFCSGFQLIGMGILGQYLWRAAVDQRQRPEYCVQKTLRSRRQVNTRTISHKLLFDNDLTNTELKNSSVMGKVPANNEGAIKTMNVTI